ncbi:hypothetical protein GGE65_008171 [Skermanella aerolata]
MYGLLSAREHIGVAHLALLGLSGLSLQTLGAVDAAGPAVQVLVVDEVANQSENTALSRIDRLQLGPGRTPAIVLVLDPRLEPDPLRGAGPDGYEEMEVRPLELVDAALCAFRDQDCDAKIVDVSEGVRDQGLRVVGLMAFEDDRQEAAIPPGPMSSDALGRYALHLGRS